MKILIAADMEGISGVTNWNQVNQDHSEYSRFRKIMTDDVNAAIRGAFKAGATDIIVTDGHGLGTNILIEDLDPRVRLNAGNSSPYAMVQGIQSGDIDGVLFVGYHARSGSPNAILAHTWSSKKVANVWINDVLMGEYGLNGALCGHFKTPVLMISGDQTICAQAVELLGDLETVIVKHATSFTSGDCLTPKTAQTMIQKAASKAITRLTEGKAPSPYKVSTPIDLVIEFRFVEMADNASRLPGSSRIKGNAVSMTCMDMTFVYKSFRAAVNLA